jgi:hypothetical protein
MLNYDVTITMADGSTGRHVGHYRDPSAAADRAIGLFPTATKISVLRPRLCAAPLRRGMAPGQSARRGVAS